MCNERGIFVYHGRSGWTMLFWNKLCLDLLPEKFFVFKVSFFNIILTKDERTQLTYSLLNCVKHAKMSLFRHVYKCLLMKCSTYESAYYVIEIQHNIVLFCDIKNCWLCFPSSYSLNMDLWLLGEILKENISFSPWCHSVTWHFLFGWQENWLSHWSLSVRIKYSR